VTPSSNDRNEVTIALARAASAETLAQLRQSQAILIPALTGASLAATAAMLGLSRNRTCVLRRQFRAGDIVDADKKARGGRRRFLLSIDDEARFLQPWRSELHASRRVPVRDIHIAYECVVGRNVAKSTIYRLLARHGWPKALRPQS
jgi:hypothetical protein